MLCLLPAWLWLDGLKELLEVRVQRKLQGQKSTSVRDVKVQTAMHLQPDMLWRVTLLPYNAIKYLMVFKLNEFCTLPRLPNSWSLWFITESEITKSSWGVNASLQLGNVLWQYLTHYTLLPYVVSMKAGSRLLFPGQESLIYTLASYIWSRRTWTYQWPLLPYYPEFTDEFIIG